MSLISSLFKIREAKQEDVPLFDLAEEEAFTRWISQPYFEKFIKDLEYMALTEGLGLTDGSALLKSVGKREAILGIIEGLRKKERRIRERMREDDDES
jgi:hypothetical protein